MTHIIMSNCFQELSPTSDTNIVRGLMNLFDCLTDEFHDEAKVSQMEDREVVSWIEVGQYRGK